jgi:hypothetical protein
VRLLRLHAIRFGPIRQRQLELDDEIVIVFGRNESGKSSFRSAIETIVYGFDPATRDKHPLHGWDGGAGGDLHLEALLRLETGELQRVERVLQATGKLRIASGAEEFHGTREGNRPLPWSSLPREVFQAIHSLELDDLAQLDQRVQGHVDDLLLPESPGLELRAASEVRRALRDEAQRLWRSDGRGSPLARELRERLADARLRASEAGMAEQALRRTREELHALEAELETRRVRKLELERARDESPRIAALRELARRKRAQGPPLDLAALGGRPLLDPSELVRELALLEEGRRAHVERVRRAELALAPGEALLLARASEIEAAAARAGRDAADAERAADFERRERALREEEESELARAVEAPIGDAERAAARAAPLEALRSAQAGWARAFEGHVERAGARAPAWVIALAAAGALALLAALLLGDAPMLAAVGAASLLIAVVALLRGPGARPTAPVAPEGLDSLLAGLQVPRERRASHAALAQVVDALDRARRAGGEAERCAAEARRLADTVAQGERSARELCADVGIESEGAPEARAARLRDALRAARVRERDVLQDRAERARARESLDATEPALLARVAHRDALLGFLERAEPGAGTPGERFERVTRRQREREFVRQREAELLADPVCARLAGDPRVRADAPGHEPEGDAAAILEELRECDDAISSARESVGRLRQRLADDPGSQRAAAQDEVADLEERLAATLRLRDRLALQESLVARAESAFRDEHQPDVLRRASDYRDACSPRPRHLPSGIRGLTRPRNRSRRRASPAWRQWPCAPCQRYPPVPSTCPRSAADVSCGHRWSWPPPARTAGQRCRPRPVACPRQ